MASVRASDFARKFGEYQRRAKRQAVAVTSRGKTTGYCVSAAEYEALQRYRANAGRSFATADLPRARLEVVLDARMDPRHDHLNALLDDAT